MVIDDACLNKLMDKASDISVKDSEDLIEQLITCYMRYKILSITLAELEPKEVAKVLDLCDNLFEVDENAN